MMVDKENHIITKIEYLIMALFYSSVETQFTVLIIAQFFGNISLFKLFKLKPDTFASVQRHKHQVSPSSEYSIILDCCEEIGKEN